MKPKSTLILDDEFIQYCKLNNIDDVVKFAKQVFNKGFTIVKYGEIPKSIELNKEKIENITTEPKPQTEVKIEKIVKTKKENKDLYDE